MGFDAILQIGCMAPIKTCIDFLFGDVRKTYARFEVPLVYEVLSGTSRAVISTSIDGHVSHLEYSADRG